jgi:Ca2+-binding EF-hand superfamily protein
MTREPLRARFDTVDHDGDGRIDVGEFEQLLDAIGMGFTEPQARAAFVDIDRDADGRIDVAEFSAWWSAR